MCSVLKLGNNSLLRRGEKWKRGKKRKRRKKERKKGKNEEKREERDFYASTLLSNVLGSVCLQ